MKNKYENYLYYIPTELTGTAYFKTVFAIINLFQMTTSYNEVPDIVLQDLVDEGILAAGTKVYASSDTSIVGIINSDGAISLDFNGETRIFPYPSGAARAIVNLSVNGWLFWKILDGGVYKELSQYKEAHKKSLLK